MCDVNKLFYTPEGNNDPIEGYLGDPKDCKILFVLKEPHEPNADGFWFKEKVVDKAHDMLKGAEKQYFHVLGITAKKLIGTTAEDYGSVLKRCAFINIYPFSGEATASMDFKSVAKMLRTACPEQGLAITKGSHPEEIACNRKAIIFGRKWEYVVSVKDVFEKLMPDGIEEFDGFKTDGITRPAFCYQGTTFLKIHHPNRASYKEFEEMEFKKDKKI